MNSSKDHISLLKAMVSTARLAYSAENQNKATYLHSRRKAITDLRTMMDNEVYITNKDEVFYLALTYLDFVFIHSNQFHKQNKAVLDDIIFSCLSLAAKAIGTFTDDCLFAKPLLSPQLLKEYEIKCLRILGYRLIYSTPYDFIKTMFYSNDKLFYTAKTLLASYALNDDYLNHSSSIIAFGLINYSIEIIGLPQRYLIAFDRYIHSTEANQFKHEFKHIEYKKRKNSQMKTMFNAKKSPGEACVLSSSLLCFSDNKGNRKTYESTETSTSTLSHRSNNSPIRVVGRNNDNLYTSSMNSLNNNDNNLNLNYKKFSSINIGNMSYLAKNYLSIQNNQRYTGSIKGKMH